MYVQESGRGGRDGEAAVAVLYSIVAYRSKSCMDVSCPTAALMVGVEICSGITNSMIDNVVSHCVHITSVSDLIEIGIPANHADHIMAIICSHIKKDTCS